MRSPEGKDYWMRGVYREVVAPERLVFTDLRRTRTATRSPAHTA